jgi:hydrogenase nickel incorporation protein HypB
MEIKIVEKILAENEALAEENRRLLSGDGVYAINLMGPPGAGKTAILEATLEAVVSRSRAAVIEGDVATTADAERLSRFGIPIVQINTDRFGGECHLEAGMIKSALAEIPLPEIDLLFIENIGNLICPAEFDLGQHSNVVVLDITGGMDKPLKYPLMFHISQALLINKIDLSPDAETEVAALTQNALRANPTIACFPMSAKTGEGVARWIEWLLGSAMQISERR